MSSHAWLLSLPITLPLMASIATYFYNKSPFLRPTFLILHLAATVSLAVAVLEGGVIATSVGNWLAPYGIVLIADPFSAIMLASASVIFVACMVGEKRYGAINPLIFLLQAGVSLSFVTGDLFNLFVAFEMMLISSYGIISITAKREVLGNAYSYLSMNVVASFIYLIAVAAFYGYTGNLNFAALATIFGGGDPFLATIPIFILTIVLAIKSGVFPFYFWLPDSYPALPSRLAALFSGTLTKVGVYVIYRLYITVFFVPDSWLNSALLILSCLTMFLGVIGALSQKNITNILSYHILSQVGYMLFALTLSSTLAITAGIIFIVHNMMVKSSLFLIGGIVESYFDISSVKKLKNLFTIAPLLGALFLIQAFSLAGLPPLSGFWGKYLIFFEGMKVESYAAVLVALLTSFLTLFSMLKIWNKHFIGEGIGVLARPLVSDYAGPILLAFISISMGLFANETFQYSKKAAESLLNNKEYIAKSLESGAKGIK